LTIVVALSAAARGMKPRKQKAEKEETLDPGTLPSDLDEENALAKVDKLKGGSRKLGLEWIDKRARKIVDAKSFIKAPKSLLVEIIQRDTFGIKEIDLLEALFRWGEANGEKKEGKVDTAGLKKSLAEFLPYIRFPTLKATELASKIVPRGILEPDETLELFSYVAIADRGGKPTPGKSIVKFNSTKRKIDDLLWDGSTPQGGVAIEEDGKVLHSLPFTGENTSCRTKVGWTEGVHTWTITFISIGSVTSFRAGFVTDGFTSWQRSSWAIGNDSNLTAAGFYSGCMVHGGFESAGSTAPSFSTGTVLRLSLDLNARTFSVGKQGETVNLVIRNLPLDRTYYPAITFYDKSTPCRIRIEAIDQ